MVKQCRQLLYVVRSAYVVEADPHEPYRLGSDKSEVVGCVILLFACLKVSDLVYAVARKSDILE